MEDEEKVQNKKGDEVAVSKFINIPTIEELAVECPKVKITENQLKVMTNKYLRGDSPELWLRRIARNIALAELLYMDEPKFDQILDNAHHEILISDFDPKARVILLQDPFADSNKRWNNFLIFESNLLKLADSDPECAKILRNKEEEIYSMLSNFDFLPNSPCLMNAGRDLQMLHACFVLPVPDSIEGIFKAVTAQALIHKSGGGTGFAFSRIRPESDLVKSTNGIASGPMSFIRIFDTATDVIKQGSTRRGANMGILHYRHPDIRKFITSKSRDKGFLLNFNISVALDKEFFDAVENDSEFELLNPRNNKPVGTERAKEIWDLMSKCAWETGDPGFVVIDRINNTESNPTPQLGQIESTNPCGEQPLLSWEPCTLGSINLSNHVKNVNGKNVVDYEKLSNNVKLAVNFLDNVVDMSNYALPEIERISKMNRRIGLGVMGWAEMLVKLEIPYDSDDAITLAEELMGFINTKALEYSEELAGVRGVFYNIKDSIYDENGKNFRGKSARPRNCARTTIAPTGTIAITAGLQGSGIEPFFAIAYKRFQAEAVDALRRGEEPEARYVYYEVIPMFLKLAEANNWFGIGREALLKKIVDNHGSVRGIKEIPDKVQKIFASSHDLQWKMHINHQAAFQRYTDNAVSKTINMANTVTVQEIQDAYLYAYKSGCKGVTVYRDGCKEIQVLNSGTVQKKEKKKEDRDLTKGALSDYYEIQTGYGPLHVNIVYDKEGPYRIFTSIPPIGNELSSLTSVLGVFMSKAFQAGYDPRKAIKHLNSAKGDKPLGFGPNRIDSIPHGVAVILKRHLEKTGKLMIQEQKTLTEEPKKQEHCPKCYSPNIKYTNGCPTPTCLDCGHSECS